MRYLNEEQEQRLNELLRKYTDEREQITIRSGRTIAYRGTPGEEPEIDRITPQQLENLSKAVNSPEQSTGKITISKEQSYQVQAGKTAENNTLQPVDRVQKPSSQSPQMASMQAQIGELKEQNSNQSDRLAAWEKEMTQMRSAIARQERLLQQATTPVHHRLDNWFDNQKERMGNWLNQQKERVGNRIEEFSHNAQEISDNIQERFADAKQQARDNVDRFTGVGNLQKEVQRLQEELRRQEVQQQQLLEQLRTNREQQRQQQYTVRASQIQHNGAAKPSADNGKHQTVNPTREKQEDLNVKVEAKTEELYQKDFDIYKEQSPPDVEQNKEIDRLPEEEQERSKSAKGKVKHIPNFQPPLNQNQNNSVKKEEVNHQVQTTEQKAQQTSDKSFGPVLVLNKNGNVRWKEQEAKAPQPQLKEQQLLSKTEIENKVQVKVHVSELKQWQQEAQHLGRSEQYLNKIEQIKEKAGSNGYVNLKSQDYEKMQGDHKEFKGQSQSEVNSQSWIMRR